MNKRDIIQMFNDAPIQKFINNLRAENAVLNTRISYNNKQISKHHKLLDHEQNEVADRLDELCPQWRKLLIDELIQSQK